LIRIAPHIAWNCEEGELVLFDARDGSYHALNGTGAAIWRAIAAGNDRPDIVDRLAAQFDAPRPAIEENVAEFIDAALARGLLEDPA
jgi:hypothetical protein